MIVAAGNCPTDSTVKMYLSFFLPGFKYNFTNWNVVLEVNQVKRFSCLFTLSTKDAFLWTCDLKQIFTNVKYLGRTGVSDGFLLIQSDINGVINLNLRLRVESGKCTGCPFGMHFSNSLLYIESDVDLLISCQLNNGYSKLLVGIDTGIVWDRSDWFSLFLFVMHTLINWVDIESSDYSDILFSILNIQNKILFANSTLLNTFQWTLTLPRILKSIHLIAHKRNQTNPLTKPLIV